MVRHDPIETLDLRANGLRFTCLAAGPVHGRPVLLLHGFPDDAGTWRDMLGRWAALGCRAVAPYMRGYAPTEPAPDGRYMVADLAADAVALIDVLGAGPALIVGHDWGAAAAYAAANLAPDRVAGVATMAVPPMRTLMGNLPKDPGQLRRSWYMGLFQLPGIAERALAKDDFALIERLWRDWSPGWVWPAERMAELKATFAAPGTVAAALGYYRGLLAAAPRHRRAWRRSRALSFARVPVPGVVLAGARDGCMGEQMFAGSEAAFAAPARSASVPAAGHFMHLERPGRTWAELQRGLDAVGLKAYTVEPNG